MSYNLKYFNEFKSIDNQTYRIEILEYNYSGVVAEMMTTSQPILITQSPVDRFEVVQGSGADINIISETSMQYKDLYTVDMQQFQVKLYKNERVIWCGYLDSELYNENYSYSTNYPVTFTANDGLNILDRLFLFDDNGDKYEGIYSIFDLVKIIFSKLNLPYAYLYIGISSKVAYNEYANGISVLEPESGETFLHQLKVNTSNYYDELGESLTLREILEAFLAPIGLKIKLNPYNNSLYIFDLNLLKSEFDKTFKKYSMSDFSYVEDIVIAQSSNVYNITDDLSYGGTGQQFTFTPAINKQTLTYSPYGINPLLNIEIENDVDKMGVENGEYDTLNTYGTGEYMWYEFSYSTHSQVSKSNNGSIIKQAQLDLGVYKPIDSYLKWSNDNNPSDKTDVSNNQSTILTTIETPIVIASDNYLRLNLECYLHTKNDYQNPDEKSKANIVCAYLYAYVKIGDHYYNSDESLTYKWSTAKSLTKIPIYIDGYYILNSANNICDKWVSAHYNYVPFYEGVLMKMNSVLLGYSGKMTIEFVSHFDTCDFLDTAIDVYNYEYKNVKDVRIKNISVDVLSNSDLTVENTESVKNEDVIIESYLDKRIKNEGAEIQIMHGSKGVGLDRGAYLYNNYTSIMPVIKYLELIQRNGINNTVENHLLNSVVSNFQYPSATLSNLNFKSNTIANPVINLFTDSGYLITIPEMWVNGYVFDPANNNMNFNLIEIKEDNLNISDE